MKCGGGFWWGRMGLRSVSGYLGLALVFVWDGALRERFCCCFSGLFGASIGEVLILVVVVVGALGYHFMEFGHFLIFPNF